MKPRKIDWESQQLKIELLEMEIQSMTAMEDGRRVEFTALNTQIWKLKTNNKALERRCDEQNARIQQLEEGAPVSVFGLLFRRFSA